jgi:hypothetical protein
MNLPDIGDTLPFVDVLQGQDCQSSFRAYPYAAA